MKRFFSFLCVLCCASVMGFAEPYCERVVTTTIDYTSLDVTVTVKKQDANTVRVILDNEHITGIRAGGTFQQWGNGVWANQDDAVANFAQGWTQDGNAWYKDFVFSTYPTTDNFQIYILMDHNAGTPSVAGFTLTNIDINNECSGGGDPTPDPDPEPTPAGIDWSSISWLTNASGNPAFTNKYKASAGDPGPSNIDVIQNPGWATKPGLYMTFPNADFRNFSLPASCYDLQGAGVIFHMDAFTAKETKVHVNVGGTVRTFTIYYEDGAEGPAEIYDINFARADNGSSATASSGTAGAAIDGNEGTRWESSHTDDETWTLDMGQKRIFNTIKILWEGAYCKEFALTYSNDGENWSELYTETNLTQAGWQTIELGENVTAQYIKYHGTLRATGWGQSFYEFQVFLAGVSVLTSIDLTATAQMAEVGGAGVALTAQPKDQNGNNMEAEVSYEITPAAAGHMSGNTYIPDQIGSASIRAYNGEVYSSAVTIAAYEGTNVALNKTDDEITVSGYDEENNLFPRFAVDDNEGSLWSARHGETGGERVYDAWINVDLGAYYDINLIAIRWEGACSRHYHVDFSADNSAWRTAYNAGWNAMATHWEYLIGTAEDATKVRYVRVWSTEAVSQYGVKIMALKVYATEWADSGDTEEPVMTSASLVSKTYNSAVIAVEATDNHEVARYHVVDGTNNIDANFVASDGKITVTGLSASTAYNFTITAKDIAGNESANNKVVAVTTNAYLTAPTAAATPPAWDASLVKAIYSPTYSADCNFANWGGCVAYTADTYGKKFVMGADCWGFGLDGYTLNCLSMEKLHADIWIADDASLRLVPIYGGTGLPTDDTHGKFVNLVGQQWNSIDLDLASDFAGLNLASIFQFKIDNANGLTIWVGNLYFYREAAIVDSEAPTNVSATVATAGFYSAQISVQASDNSGAVNFSVKNGLTELATGSAASDVATTITVNGLTPGTSYNLSVIASDESGNEAAPKALSVRMNALPVPAPMPVDREEDVKSLYSNAYTPAVTLTDKNQNWYQAPRMTELTLGGDDNALLYDNLSNPSTFGWNFASLDAAGFQKLHVSIYPVKSGTIEFYPVIAPENQYHRVSQTLEANKWNDVVIDYSDKSFAAFTQLGFTNYSNLGAFLIDNVYFSRPVVKSNVDKWATFAASAAIKVPSGVTVYKAVHEVLGNEEVLRLTKIVSGVIPANTGALLQCETESATYAFTLATSGEADVAADEFEGNSLVGCAVKTDISDIAATHDIYALRHSDAYGFSGFFLYSGTIVNAGKAYLPIEKDPATPAPSRRLRFVYDTATDVENVQPAASGVQKVLKDGQLYILRDEVTYTIQGVRVE